MKLLNRLFDKCTIGDECWEWTGSQNGKGYGQILKDGHMRVAHRVMYEVMVGPIPEGLELDHLCRNTLCVRPDHLEPVTRTENIHRSRAASFGRSKTHCPSGHAYDDENTYRHPVSGTRSCIACRREAAKRHAERQRGT